MTREDIGRSVTKALASRGFKPKVTPDGIDYRGLLKVGSHTVGARLSFVGLDFFEAPRVVIVSPNGLPRPVIPHLDESGELCVFERQSYVFDRYNAAGFTLGILDRAVEVLERGLTRHATDDIAAEFPQTWGGLTVALAFGAYEGPLHLGADAGGKMLITPASDKKQDVGGCSVVTDARLSFTPTQARPTTLGALLDWAGDWDKALSRKIARALSSFTDRDPYCIINAPNGSVGFELCVSDRGSQVAKLGKGGKWASILASPFGRGLPIKRLQGRRVDLDYVLGRNTDGKAPLKDRKVVVIGCGSIGGFLSRSLAQLGAGLGTGSLTLIDPEELTGGNIGRHLLGTGHVGKDKAVGCRDVILADLPGLTLHAVVRPDHAIRTRIETADIVLDATGEHAVSERLNAWARETSGAAFPVLVHTWIEGRGAAVKSFVSNDPDFACYRCLQPDLAEKARYSALRAAVPPPLEGACGEAVFTPYGPAAPMMAAALATQHAVDWSKGNVRPLLRTTRIDLAETVEVKPVNPEPSDRCPACQPR